MMGKKDRKLMIPTSSLNQVCNQVQSQNLLWDRIWVDRTASEIVMMRIRNQTFVVPSIFRNQIVSQVNQVWDQVWEQILSL
jgi:hypothetical protein